MDSLKPRLQPDFTLEIQIENSIQSIIIQSISISEIKLTVCDGLTLFSQPFLFLSEITPIHLAQKWPKVNLSALNLSRLLWLAPITFLACLSYCPARILWRFRVIDLTHKHNLTLGRVTNPTAKPSSLLYISFCTDTCWWEEIVRWKVRICVLLFWVSIVV